MKQYLLAPRIKMDVNLCRYSGMAVVTDGLMGSSQQIKQAIGQKSMTTRKIMGGKMFASWLWMLETSG